jgi:hypothetical protein
METVGAVYILGIKLKELRLRKERKGRRGER